MLQSKDIRTAREGRDGLRISIMSRHTLNDGVRPDPTIHETMYDEWWPELAPPPKLIGDYYKRGLVWDEFESRFTEHLSSGAPQRYLYYLANMALKNNVTILCTETIPELCHRRIVLEQSQLLVPDVTICVQ